MKIETHAHRCALIHAMAHQNLMQRPARLVMIAEHFADAFLRQQLGADLCAIGGLLRVLENKIKGVFTSCVIHCRGKRRQRSGMPIVSAFVGDAGRLRAIRQGDGLIYGQRIHVRPERDPSSFGPSRADGIKPCAPIYDLQPGGVFPQKVHQPRLGSLLLIRKLRVGMQLVPQGYRLLIQGLIHKKHPPFLF